MAYSVIIFQKYSNVDFDANQWNCRLPVGERNVRKEMIRNQECYVLRLTLAKFAISKGTTFVNWI